MNVDILSMDIDIRNDHPVTLYEEMQMWLMIRHGEMSSILMEDHWRNFYELAVREANEKYHLLYTCYQQEKGF